MAELEVRSAPPRASQHPQPPKPSLTPSGWLKLYARGHTSKPDIVELRARNPDLELDEVRSVCARYGLGGLEELITESRSV